MKPIHGRVFIGLCILGSLLYFSMQYTSLEEIFDQPSDNSQELLVNELQLLYTKNEEQAERLKKYEADAEYIKSLGASEDTTQRIIKASNTLGVDPK